MSENNLVDLQAKKLISLFQASNDYVEAERNIAIELENSISKAKVDYNKNLERLNSAFQQAKETYTQSLRYSISISNSLFAREAAPSSFPMADRNTASYFDEKIQELQLLARGFYETVRELNQVRTLENERKYKRNVTLLFLIIGLFIFSVFVYQWLTNGS